MAEAVVVSDGGEVDCVGGGEDLNAATPAAAVELVPLALLRFRPSKNVRKVRRSEGVLG